MKKYRKLTRIISLVFALCMLMSVTGVTAYEFKSELELSIPKDVLEIMRLQEPACIANHNFITALPKDTYGNPIYPCDFAGAYIGDDYKLVIQLVSATETRKQEYLAMCQDYETIRFEDVKYSRQYLLSLMRYVETLSDCGCSICEVYVDTSSNMLCIGVVEDDLNSAKNVVKSRENTAAIDLPIAIVKGSYVRQCSTIYGGDALYNISSNTGFSAGIGGTYNGDPAILTCGHGNRTGTYVKLNASDSSNTGMVIYQRYSTQQSSPSNGEFSIIKLTANTKSTKVRGNSTLYTVPNANWRHPVENEVVMKYGKAGQYGVYEIEAHLNFMVATGATSTATAYAKNLWKCSHISSNLTYGGDSGGPVYAANGTTATMLGTIVGVPVGESQYMIFSPMTYPINVGFCIA